MFNVSENAKFDSKQATVVTLNVSRDVHTNNTIIYVIIIDM